MMQYDLFVLLHAEAKRVRQLAPNAVWYLFGSVLHTPERAADIDVLIVCESDEHVKFVRSELRDLCMRLPLHLLLLTRTEEAELGFIASQKCAHI